MKVSELREALEKFDGDDQVVVGSANEHSIAYRTGQTVVNLGMTKERAFLIEANLFVESEGDGDDSCDRCEHLEGVIDEIRSAIDSV